MNAAAIAGDETRMSRETPICCRLEIGDEAAADLRARPSSLISAGYRPRMS